MGVVWASWRWSKPPYRVSILRSLRANPGIALGIEGEDRPSQSLPGNAVAHLEYDDASGRYRIRFRYGGKEYKRSLKTAGEGEANSVLWSGRGDDPPSGAGAPGTPLRC